MKEEKKTELFVNYCKMAGIKDYCNRELEFFKAGINALEQFQDQEKINKANRKNHVFNAYDFIDFSKENEKRDSLRVVHYQNNSEVVTNGKFLLTVPAKYDPELENTSFYKPKEKCTGQFPNYLKVIPDSTSLEKTDLFSLDDLLILKKCSSTKSEDKQKYIYINIGENHNISYHTMINLLKFWQCFPDCELYRPKEHEKLNSWVLKNNSGAIFVYMPLNFETDCSVIYDKINKMFITK